MVRNNIFKNIDGQILFIIIILILTGLINIYSSEYNEMTQKIFISTNFGKQVIWLGISFVIFILILIVDVRLIINLGYFIYFFIIILLIATYFLGKEVYGTKAWFSFGWFNLQPSEFAKFATALAMAKYMDNFNFRIDKKNDLFKLFGLIALPVAIIIIQNDFGSALVFSSFIFVLFRQGLSPWMLYVPIILSILFIMVLVIDVLWSVVILVVIALLIFVFIYKKKRALFVTLVALGLAIGFVLSVDYIFDNVLKPHHKTRLNVLLGKEVDLKGSGYNVHQSIIAIGSGGITGKGFLKGTQTKLNFVPEQSTDFIYCTIAEEYGFIGSLVLIILFAWLLIRILLLAERQKLKFVRIYGYAVVSVIFFHFTFNIAMTMGVFPVIGIPLPFISYGGSSLLGFIILVALFLKMDADYKHYFN